jgi:hypothetical protein
MIGPREIVAGVAPAHRNGKSATLTGDLVHDVSILPGVGCHLGSQPRAKTSMTIMRAPQCGPRRGHGGSCPEAARVRLSHDRQVSAPRRRPKFRRASHLAIVESLLPGAGSESQAPPPG